MAEGELKKKKPEELFWSTISHAQKEQHAKNMEKFKDISPQKTRAMLEEIQVPSLELIHDEPRKKKHENN